MFAMNRQIVPVFLIIINFLHWRPPAQVPEPTNVPMSTLTPTQTIPTITPMGNLRQEVKIVSPVSGQAIQGKIAILGSTNLLEIQSLELAFAYANDPTDTWFLLISVNEPVIDGVIAEWDTSTISDGNYELLLVVNLSDGGKLVTTVESLRVRNSSPIETNTPPPIRPTSEIGEINNAAHTPTTTPILPTPTPFPKNPAVLSTYDLAYNFGKGALVTVGFIALVGLFLAMRKNISG